MTRSRLARRTIPVAVEAPVQLVLGLPIPDPIGRPARQQPPRDPEAAVLRVMARRRAAA